MYYFTIKNVVHVVLFSVLPFAVWRSAITCSVCACLAMPDSIVRGTSMKLILSILNYKLEKGLMKCDVWTWCRCAPGYYGNPVVIGSTCQPCHCNGNSDPNMLFSDCHPLTGECQSCMHNTAGPHCEICAPGYYGDAITAKNCTRMNTFSVYQDWDLVFRYYHQVSHDFFLFIQGCNCSPCGTDHCDPQTGQCHCKPGVVAAHCDRCEVCALFCFCIVFTVWDNWFIDFFRTVRLALIRAPVAISVNAMLRRRWFCRVTPSADRVPVGLEWTGRTAVSVHRVTGTTALMAAGVSAHTCTLIGHFVSIKINPSILCAGMFFL